MKVEMNSDGKGIKIAQQAISVTTDATIARLCTLLEATILNEDQCDAVKKTLKGILREEIDRMSIYLEMRSKCDLNNEGIPDTYKRRIISN